MRHDASKNILSIKNLIYLELFTGRDHTIPYRLDNDLLHTAAGDGIAVWRE